MEEGNKGMRKAWLVSCLLLAGCAAKKPPVAAAPPPIRSQAPPPIAELIEHCVVVKQEKCQHGDLQLSARDHRDRFKNGAHHASLQENERGKVRPVVASGGQDPFIIARGPQNGLSVIACGC